MKSPIKYEKRMLRYGEKPAETVYYDPKPHVIVIDEKAGKYALKWIGYDGKEKIVEYRRPGLLDIVVSASVKRTDSGQYLYTYNVQNLPSSPTYLSGFIVQNFAADTRPVAVNGIAANLKDINLIKAFRNAPPDGKPRNIPGVFMGEMSNDSYRFKEGRWIDVGILPSFKPELTPGQNIEIQFLSSAPPGLVSCTATGGELSVKGAGEHMPTELEETLPGYEEWPSGFTIGPIESLKPLSTAERVNYLLDRLPQFQKLGWITANARQWYEKNLKPDNIEAVLERAQQDLKNEQITSEVLAIVQSMK